MAEEIEKKEVETVEKIEEPVPTDGVTLKEISLLIMDLQGQLTNLQQSFDHMQPAKEEVVPVDEVDVEPIKEPTPEEIAEVDKLLQGD